VPLIQNRSEQISPLEIVPGIKVGLRHNLSSDMNVREVGWDLDGMIQ
jgi:hypothetical protein